jgi:hypothetical protein
MILFDANAIFIRCQRGDLDRLVQVSDNIVFESLEHVLAQRATCPMRDR